MLFSEPKIPQYTSSVYAAGSGAVSVLFSEPKIPQSRRQRAAQTAATLFQCSSASRKFLNPTFRRVLRSARSRFSALQRAENSSIEIIVHLSVWSGIVFQCSSASRKFLNQNCRTHSIPHFRGFSALQRAENSSIIYANTGNVHRHQVSVLFSEPKIPQSPRTACAASVRLSFSALQRAENSSIGDFVSPLTRGRSTVSVLFSEPKIPQCEPSCVDLDFYIVSVLFSEPKIPQSRPSHLRPSIFPTAMITLRHS